MSNELTKGGNVDWGVAPSGLGGRETASSGEQVDWVNGVQKAGPINAAVLEDAGMPQHVIQYWQRDPAGLRFRFATAQNAVAVLNDLPPSERRGMISSFEFLSEKLQSVVIDELAQGEPGHVRSVPERALEAARESDFGIVLERHWRGRFPQKMAIIAYRWRNLRSQLSSLQQEELDDYFDNMTTRERVAACIAFAGG